MPEYDLHGIRLNKNVDSLAVSIATSPEDAAQWCAEYQPGDTFTVVEFIPLEGLAVKIRGVEVTVAQLVEPLVALSGALGEKCHVTDLLTQLVQAAFEAGRNYQHNYGDLHKKA